MKRSVVALIAVVLLITVGCAGVQTGTKLNSMRLVTSGDDAVAHVNAESYGIYAIFGMFPLLTGDTSSTAGGLALLADSCKVEPVVEMATRAAKEMNATRLTDLQSSVSGFPIIPFILSYKSVQVSGNAVK